MIFVEPACVEFDIVATIAVSVRAFVHAFGFVRPEHTFAMECIYNPMADMFTNIGRSVAHTTQVHTTKVTVTT